MILECSETYMYLEGFQVILNFFAQNSYVIDHSKSELLKNY